MRELSKAEKFVLTKLEENSRQPLSKIAKEGRLSSEGVAKIIKRLEKNKIIIGYQTKSNYSKLGITIYKAYIKLKRKDHLIKAKVKKILEKHPCCHWYSFCEGEFDLRVSVEIKSAQDTGDMKNLFIELDELVSEKQMLIFLNAFSFSKTFNEGNTRKLFTVINYKDPPVTIGEPEERLIKLLRLNPQIKIIDASDKLKISIKTASKFQKRLINQGVITGFKCKVNMANLNYLPYVALFALGKYSESDIEEFKTYCKNKKEVTYFIYGTGSYSIEVEFFTKTTNEFYKIIDEIRERFPFIRKISTMIERY